MGGKGEGKGREWMRRGRKSRDGGQWMLAQEKEVE
jgi:hypothetical protein